MLPLNPAFSSIVLLHMFIQAFDTLKIPEHCFGFKFGNLDTLKKVICLSILQVVLKLLQTCALCSGSVTKS